MPIVIRNDPNPVIAGTIAYESGKTKERNRRETQALELLDRERDRQLDRELRLGALSAASYERDADRDHDLRRMGLQQQQQLERYQVQDDFYRARDESQQLLEDVGLREEFVIENLDHLTPEGRQEWSELSGKLRAIRGDRRLNPAQKQSAIQEWLRLFDESRLDAKVKKPPTSQELFEQSIVVDPVTGRRGFQNGMRNGAPSFEFMDEQGGGSSGSTGAALSSVLGDRKTFKEALTEAETYFPEEVSDGKGGKKYNNYTMEDRLNQIEQLEGLKQERIERLNRNARMDELGLSDGDRLLVQRFLTARKEGWLGVLLGRIDEDGQQRLVELEAEGVIDLNNARLSQNGTDGVGAPEIPERMLGDGSGESAGVDSLSTGETTETPQSRLGPTASAALDALRDQRDAEVVEKEKELAKHQPQPHGITGGRMSKPPGRDSVIPDGPEFQGMSPSLNVTMNVLDLYPDMVDMIAEELEIPEGRIKFLMAEGGIDREMALEVLKDAALKDAKPAFYDGFDSRELRPEHITQLREAIIADDISHDWFIGKLDEKDKVAFAADILNEIGPVGSPTGSSKKQLMSMIEAIIDRAGTLDALSEQAKSRFTFAVKLLQSME